MGKKTCLEGRKNLKELQQQDRSKRSITTILLAALSDSQEAREIRERQEGQRALALAPVLNESAHYESAAQSRGKKSWSPGLSKANISFEVSP